LRSGGEAEGAGMLMDEVEELMKVYLVAGGRFWGSW